VSRLTSIDVATGTKTAIFDGDAVQPAWSPDGRWLAFWGLPAGTGRRVIYTMASTGGPPTALVDDTSLNWSPKWSADGRYIYFASDREPPMNIWRVPIDPATGGAAGPASRVTVSTEEHFALSGGAAGAFVISSRTSTSEIRKYPFDPGTGRVGADSSLVMRSSRQVSSIAASPDGEYLALMISDPREDLMVMRVDGSSVTRLTNDAFRDRGPAWTADSDRLFFYSDRSGQYEGWSIRRDGSGLEQVTKQPAGARRRSARDDLHAFVQELS
jgi:TolB protein